MALASVIIDSREPKHIQDLTFGGVPTAVIALDAGDVLCACEDGELVVIERKTASDFLNTLKAKRLFPQVAKLRASGAYAYLVICGNLMPGPAGHCLSNGQETGWTWAAVSGALLSVQELGVHVLQIGSDHDFEGAVVRLGNRSHGEVRIAPARDITIVSEQAQILAAFPGIGIERAELLLAHFDVATAFTYLTMPASLQDNEILPKVPGIGEGVRRKIRQTLGLWEGQYIWIQSEEPK